MATQFQKPTSLPDYLAEAKRSWDIANACGVAQPWDQVEEKLRMQFASWQVMDDEQWELSCQEQAKMIQPHLQNLLVKIDGAKRLIEEKAKKVLTKKYKKGKKHAGSKRRKRL